MKYKPVFQELEEQVAWRRDQNHPLNKLMEKYSARVIVNNAKTVAISKPQPKKHNTSFAPHYDWLGL